MHGDYSIFSFLNWQLFHVCFRHVAISCDLTLFCFASFVYAFSYGYFQIFIFWVRVSFHVLRFRLLLLLVWCMVHLKMVFKLFLACNITNISITLTIRVNVYWIWLAHRSFQAIEPIVCNWFDCSQCQSCWVKKNNNTSWKEKNTNCVYTYTCSHQIQLGTSTFTGKHIKAHQHK